MYVTSHHIMVYLQLKFHHHNQITKKTPNTNDDIEIEFSKNFTDYIKNIQHQNSQIQYSQTMYSQSFIAIYPY